MLSLGHLNVRSLLNKFNVLLEHVRAEDYDVFGVSESWLNQGIDSGAVRIPNYSFVRQDRPTRGGGIGIYVKSNIEFSTLLKETKDFLEQVWIKIKVPGQTIIIGNIYRPPNSDYTQFLNHLEDTLTNLFTEGDLLFCLGDFNVNLYDSESNNTISLVNLADSFGLQQVIDAPTRITAAGYSLIDLIFSTSNELASIDVVDIQVSDHMLIRCRVGVTAAKKPTYNFSFRALRNIDLTLFQRDLELIQWHNLYAFSSIDDKVDFLTGNVVKLFDLHAPVRQVRGKTRPYSPWITENIRLMQTLRNRALNRFRNTRTPEHRDYYRQLRNLTTNAIRAEKRAYLNTRFQNTNQQEKWRELKKLNVIKNVQCDLPQSLSNPSKLNKYFVELSRSNDAPDPALINFYSNNTSVNNLFSFKPVNDLTILEIVQNIKSRAIGQDKLNITLILMCCPFLIPYIRHIINVCIKKSYFPIGWKKATIIPIPKVKNPTELGHLRSISILPVLSKILEKVLEQQMQQFLTENKIIPVKQSGFRPGFSCATALTDVTDDILKALDSDKASILVMLDYSKAFDMLNHDTLVAILNYYGFSADAIGLIKSFLTDRVQQVKIKGSTSEMLNVICGVPQGSILGPLLYSIYTSTFVKEIKHCNYHLYADDTQLYYSFYPSHTLIANNQINSDLKALHSISKQHMLKLNPNKSVAMLFCGESQRLGIMNDLDISIADIKIPFQDKAKNLGLIIDNKLRFKAHVTSKLKIAYTTLKSIFSLRHSLNPDVKALLCDSLILSLFNFCDNVYASCLDSMDIRRIQKVQNSCLRFIFGIRRRNRISHKLIDLGWLNMYNRRVLHTSCFVYKVIKNKCPPYLLQKLTFRTDVHSLNIRRKTILTIPRHNKELFKRSFTYYAASHMNRYASPHLALGCLSFKKTVKRNLLLEQTS